LGGTCPRNPGRVINKHGCSRDRFTVGSVAGRAALEVGGTSITRGLGEDDTSFTIMASVTLGRAFLLDCLVTLLTFPVLLLLLLLLDERVCLAEIALGGVFLGFSSADFFVGCVADLGRCVLTIGCVFSTCCVFFMD